jgi:hypothetical protein
MPSNFGLMNVQDLNAVVDAIVNGRITPDGLEKIQKACALCERRQIAKASTVDAWPADLAPTRCDNSNPANVALQGRQLVAHGHR